MSNLQGSLHLDRISVHWHDDRPRTARRSLHQTPHLSFGRLENFPEVEIYLLFPHLYRPSRDHWDIPVEDYYTTWTDRILLPAIRQVYPESAVQHFPASAEQIALNASAAQVEGRSGPQIGPTYNHDLHYNLQGDQLGALWHDIQQRVLHVFP